MVDLSNIQLSPVSLPFETTIQLYMLRLDSIDSSISGNKWFKLKKNFEEASSRNISSIITFGGAFSNHIAAAAKACQLNGFKSTGIIRGENVLNHTLIEAQNNGMELRFVTRELYRNKPQLLEWLKKEYSFEKNMIIPEGGANIAGVEGCKEIIDYISIPFDYITVACGTGTTLAGITHKLNNNQHALGFSSLKGGEFLSNSVKEYTAPQWHHNFRIINNYHFGGYAKYNEELLNFMSKFKKTQGIELDFIYTAKMMYGLFDLILKKYFREHAVIVAVHSGGLQGNKGINI